MGGRSRAVAIVAGQGYGLIDTAAHYPSEAAVGRALEEARRRGLISGATPLAEQGQDLNKDAAEPAVTVVTKLWFDSLGYEKALAAATASLANLRTEQLDWYP